MGLKPELLRSMLDSLFGNLWLLDVNNEPAVIAEIKPEEERFHVTKNTSAGIS